MRLPVAAALVIILVTPALAQQGNPSAPPMPTGKSDTPPKKRVVAEAADQILTRNIVGQPLYGSDHSRLGTITEGAVDRRRRALDVVILDTGLVEPSLYPIAWPDIDATDRKHLTANLGKSDLEKTSADQSVLDQVRQNPDVLGVKADLLDKPVVGASGERVGELHDLVVTMGSGQLAAALIGVRDGLLAGIQTATRAVPWSVISLPQDKRGAIAIDLTKDQVKAEPAFATKAPDTAQRDGPGSGSSAPEPLNFGGRREPSPSPPPTRRTE